MIKPSMKSNPLKQTLLKGGQTLSAHLAIFAAAFITARCQVLSVYSPLGIALSAGVGSEYTFSAAAGALLGYLIPTGGQSNVRYMGAVALCALCSFFLRSLFKQGDRPLFAALCGGGSLFVVLTVLTIAGEATETIPIMVGECFLAAGGGYFFACFFQVLEKGGRFLTTHQIAAGAVSVTLLLTALMELTVYDLSPARIVAIIIVLYAARYGKEPIGAIAGIATGFAVFLHDPDLTAGAIGICLAGLVAGMFAPLGKFGVTIGFLIANGLVAIQNFHPTGFALLYETAIASVVFMVMPKRANQWFARLFAPAPQHSLVEGLRSGVVMRLSFASEAVQDVSQTVEAVATKLKKLNAPTFERVFSQTEQAACRSCSMRIYCWESNRGETLSALLTATKALRQRGAVTTDDLPASFTGHCVDPEKVLDHLATQFADYLAKDAAQRRLEEIRLVIAQQFDGVSRMLGGLSEEFRNSHRYDYTVAEEIQNALFALSLHPLDISCMVDAYDRLTAEIRLEADGTSVNRTALLRMLKDKCGREFEVPTITDSGQSLLITLSEKAEFSVDFGLAQYSFNDNKLCGDACESFYDGRGRFAIIVSDGMGKGGRAAVDGAMASGLTARLLRAGFDPDSALKVVNSAMLYKSTDESLATLDVTLLDLFSGQAEFFKAGAPATIIRKNGKAASVEGETLPAGILQEVCFDRTAVGLSSGDVIVMVSDGALCDGSDWLGVELEVWKQGSAAQLAEHLADYARRRCPDGKGDDITVAVAIIEKAL